MKKLVKWRLFIYADKFVDFDQDAILNIVNAEYRKVMDKQARMEEEARKQIVSR